MKKNREYDQNIINALKAIPSPLKTFDGHNVFFDIDKRDETIFEHISNKKLHFHVVDINAIPSVLKNKKCLRSIEVVKDLELILGNVAKQKKNLNT